MPVCLWSTPPRSPAVWLMQLKKKKKALLFLTRGGVSDTPHPSFFRRSGEWTHADWLCGCVKGYPTSCSPSLQTAAAAESGGSAIFSLLCVCVCVCVWSGNALIFHRVILSAESLMLWSCLVTSFWVKLVYSCSVGVVTMHYYYFF